MRKTKFSSLLKSFCYMLESDFHLKPSETTSYKALATFHIESRYNGN